jgi:hypothetical protein
MYADKRWNDTAFCEDDVRRQTISTRRLGRGGSDGSASCASTASVNRARVRPRGRGLRLTLAAPATVAILRVTARGRRRVARFTARAGATTWSGRRARRRGTYELRIRSGGALRRMAFARRGGFLRPLPAFERRDSCGPIALLSTGRPVVARTMRVAYRIGGDSRVEIRVRRRGRTVRALRRTVSGGRTYRLRVRTRGRGRYRVTLTARSGAGVTTTTVSAARN